MNILVDNPRFAISADESAMAFVYRQSARLTRDDADTIGDVVVSTGGCYTEDVGAAPPTSEYRVALSEVINSRPHEIRALAMILPGSGFAHALRVSIHTGFMFVAKGPTFPNRIFRDLDSGLTWLARWESVDERMRDGFALLGCPDI